jgi:protein-S-isoprenylcysteine O-methyltransferase Ste14
MSTLNRADLPPDASALAADTEDHSRRDDARSVICELCGRGALLAFFAFLSHHKALELWLLITNWGQVDTAKYVNVAANLASLAFLVIVLGATIFRLQSSQSAEGWEPRYSAFMGSFLTLSLIALQPVQAGSAWRLSAIMIITVGGLLSAGVLAWLGRSFSITPQARSLVTTGPYAVVRHPLYLCEEVTVIGVMLLHFSVAAVLIVAVQWMFQLRRMSNEERVLRSGFPEYAAYTRRTPKIIPTLGSRARSLRS